MDREVYCNYIDKIIRDSVSNTVFIKKYSNIRMTETEAHNKAIARGYFLLFYQYKLNSMQVA